MGRPQRHCGDSESLRRGLSRRRGRIVVASTALAVVCAFLATYAAAADTDQPAISVADASVLEGDQGVTTVLPVAVTLSRASTQTVTVNWTTTDGTAESPTAYHAASGVITFAPGDTAETAQVEIVGGQFPEWNEYFTIFLSSATNATIDRAIGKVTIISDDGFPTGVDPGEVSIAPTTGEGQCVTLKDGAGCQPLEELGQLIDLDDIALINPGTGRVEVRADAGVGQFYGGKFGVEDIPVSSTISRPILVVKLAGGNFKQCATGNRALAAKGAPVRRLWGKGKGRFRTRGRYASGTVRGTSWITEDFCDGTRMRVFVGVVQIFDFVTKKTITLKAGQSYFAKAGKIP